jgi:hypothetical protein
LEIANKLKSHPIDTRRFLAALVLVSLISDWYWRKREWKTNFNAFKHALFRCFKKASILGAMEKLAANITNYDTISGYFGFCSIPGHSAANYCDNIVNMKEILDYIIRR